MVMANLFGKKIQALRARTGLSQAKFAQAVEVKVRTLQGWEIGKSVPEYAHLILEALQARVKARRKK